MENHGQLSQSSSAAAVRPFASGRAAGDGERGAVAVFERLVRLILFVAASLFARGAHCQCKSCSIYQSIPVVNRPSLACPLAALHALLYLHEFFPPRSVP
jgi:hypothetical protein